MSQSFAFEAALEKKRTHIGVTMSIDEVVTELFQIVRFSLDSLYYSDIERVEFDLIMKFIVLQLRIPISRCMLIPHD